MACIVVDGSCLLKIRVCFVQGVVCQVDEHVLHEAFLRFEVDWLILLSGESDETLLVNEDFYGIR